MSKSIIKDKSFAFAIEIVKFCRYLQSINEYVISKQLLRSGTAIGAIVREAEFAESRADFVHKMAMALKEANETLYWLSLLLHTYTVNNDKANQLHSGCDEIVAILVSIVKTTKSSR